MKLPVGRKRRRILRSSKRLARSRIGIFSIAATSFAEATVVPIPLEAVLVPLMLLNRERIWRIATMATLGCLAAAVVGYGIGWLFFETAGRWLIETFNWESGYETAKEWIKAYGFWAVFAIGIVPIPFQTAMLLAGVTGMSFPLYLMAAALSRGLRYFGLAALMMWIAGHRKGELGKWFRRPPASIVQR